MSCSQVSRRRFLISVAGVAATNLLVPGCCRLRRVIRIPCTYPQECREWKDKSRSWWSERQSAREKQRKADQQSGKRPNVPLPQPFLWIDRQMSSRGWIGDQIKKYQLNEWCEAAFIVENRGNATSWSCYTEIYEGPWNVYEIAYTDLKLIDRKVVTVWPGQRKEVILKWVATRVPGSITVRCYDPAQDPGLLVVKQYDRKFSGGSWSKWV